jgi:hypothetical protein
MGEALEIVSYTSTEYWVLSAGLMGGGDDEDVVWTCVVALEA